MQQFFFLAYSFVKVEEVWSTCAWQSLVWISTGQTELREDRLVWTGKRVLSDLLFAIRKFLVDANVEDLATIFDVCKIAWRTASERRIHWAQILRNTVT